MKHFPVSQNQQNMYNETPTFSQQARVTTYHPLTSPKMQPRKPGMRLDPQKLMEAESPANRRMITRDLMNMCHEVDRRAHKVRDFAGEQPLNQSEFQLVFQKILNPTQVQETQPTEYRAKQEEEAAQVDARENTFNYSRQKTMPREPTIESMIQACNWDANVSPMMGARTFAAPEGYVSQKSAWSNDISKSLVWHPSPIQRGGIATGHRHLQQMAPPNQTNSHEVSMSRASSVIGFQNNSEFQAPKEKLLTAPAQGDISPNSDYMDIGTPEVTHNLHRRFQTLKMATVNPRLLNPARATLDGSSQNEYGGLRIFH